MPSHVSPDFFLAILAVCCFLIEGAVACDIGYFYFNGPFWQGCLPCPTDCDYCYVPDIWTVVTKCTKCRPRYQLLASGDCAACPAYCLTCTRTASNTDTCLTCINGYRLVNGQCQLICPDNCKTCSGVPNWFITCSECEAGYAFESEETKACVACEANCQACTNYYGQCTTCNAGYYRDPYAPFRTCLPCLQCNSGEIETAACTTLSNRQCRACASSEIVNNNRCVACVAGTYTSSDRLSCPACSVCSAPALFRRNGDECTLTRNTICSTCLQDKATSAHDLPSCDTCASGFFRQASGSTFVCARCADYPCAQNQYISCANAVRQCLTCPGTTTATACAQGLEPDKACDGRSTVPSACGVCKAGSERPAGSRSLICEKCRTGFYKDTPGTPDCGRCTNAPQFNSTYLEWGNTAADTFNCPWYWLCMHFLVWR